MLVSVTNETSKDAICNYSVDHPCLNVNTTAERAVIAHYSCPDGYHRGWNGYNYVCYPDSIVPAKNLGEPDNTCSMVGNPINAASGNKFQREEDYRSAGPFPLEFVRYYNSGNAVKAASIGAHWRHAYDRVIEDAYATGNTSMVVQVTRSDGKSYYFYSPDGAVWSADADVLEKLTRQVDGGGTTIGWTIINRSDETESYDAVGRLVGIRSRSGIQQTLAYDLSSRLASVTDSFGRSLILSYDEQNRVAALQIPGGTTFTYGYDASSNLTSVTGPDGKTRSYVYNEPANTADTNLPNALTGIIDELGSRFATFKYDSSNRAVSSEHAGGTDRVSLAFDPDPQPWNNTVAVTNALGAVLKYTFDTANGAWKLWFVKQVTTDGSAGCSCGVAAYYEHHSTGGVTNVTDFNGNTTYFERDSRGLETKRTLPFVSQGWVRTTQWHPTYRLPTEINEPGRRIMYIYDSAGNRTSESITDTASSETRTTSYRYTAMGLLQSIDGPRTDVSDVTTFAYDAQGNAIRVTNALGHVTQATQHDAHGNPLRVVDPNGVEMLLSYDGHQRLRSRSIAGAVTQFDYDAAGNVVRVTLPNGSYLSYSYDAAHRLKTVQDNLGNRIEYALDALGNRTKEEIFDATGQLRRTQSGLFSQFGLIREIRGANGQVHGMTYDAQGNLFTEFEAGQYTTQYTVDARNRVKEITDPANGKTTITYDVAGNLATVTDASNVVIRYTHNGFGELVTEASPDKGTWTYTYDPAGNRKITTDARGVTTTHTYDALNRTALVSYPNPVENIAYQYDGSNYPSSLPNGIGRKTGIVDPSGVRTLIYRADGLLEKETRVAAGQTYTTSYTYDFAGNISSITYPSGHEVSYERDTVGRTRKISADVSGTQTVLANNLAYMPFGPWSQMTAGNGVQNNRVYDLDYRIQELQGGTEFHRRLSYDARDNIKAIENVASSSGSQILAYDSLSRLTRADGPYGILQYAYKPAGDRTQETRNGVPSLYSYVSGSHRLSFIAGSGAKVFSYDQNGNAIGDGTRTFTYNQANRLEQAALSSTAASKYSYDDASRRTSKVTGAEALLFHYDPTGRLLAESNLDGTLVREYAYLDDTPVALMVPTTSVPGVNLTLPPTSVTPTSINFYYFITDHLNTPHTLLDYRQGRAWHVDYYEPFGTAKLAPGLLNSTTNNLRFPGQYFDTETGLHQNWFRDYDPTIGRYLQSDPIGLAGGLNTYLYANANPISFTDPYGLYPGQDIVEFIPDAIGADIDFVRNYVDMRSANTIGADKYFHCKANCEAASRGPGGAFESSILSEARELTDQYIKGDSPQACNADRQANNQGRQGGANNPGGASCQTICSPFRPSGLPSNY